MDGTSGMPEFSPCYTPCYKLRPLWQGEAGRNRAESRI
jgi:hypothetical protein